MSIEEFVVEELSRRTQVSVRSLRSYQSRGLLPPPQVRGRTGWYGQAHVERVRLVQRLRAAGMKLDGIARLLDAPGGDEARLLDFTERARRLFTEREPRVTTYDELVARFRIDPEQAEAVLGTATRAGLIRERDDGRIDELSPDLLAAGEAAMTALGLDALEALALLGRMRQHADGVARIYLDLFRTRIWQPFVDAGRPADAWPRVQQALDELQPLATRALGDTFELVMARRVDRAIGEWVLTDEPGPGADARPDRSP